MARASQVRQVSGSCTVAVAKCADLKIGNQENAEHYGGPRGKGAGGVATVPGLRSALAVQSSYGTDAAVRLSVAALALERAA